MFEAYQFVCIVVVYLRHLLYIICFNGQEDVQYPIYYTFQVGFGFQF